MHAGMQDYTLCCTLYMHVYHASEETEMTSLHPQLQNTNLPGIVLWGSLNRINDGVTFEVMRMSVTFRGSNLEFEVMSRKRFAQSDNRTCRSKFSWTETNKKAHSILNRQLAHLAR